jgi:hypothetical protein
MLYPQIEKFLGTRVSLGHVAAGNGDTQIGAPIDMQGWEGVLLVFIMGVITAGATPSVKAQQGALLNQSDATDIAASHINVPQATGAGQAFLVDVYRPTNRYVTPAVVRAGGQNTEILCVLAFPYGAKVLPAPVDPSVGGSVYLNSPVTGVA